MTKQKKIRCAWPGDDALYIDTTGMTTDRVIQNLLDYVSSGVGRGGGEVKAVYLHVLCENHTAIRFYERRRFRRHKRLSEWQWMDSVVKEHQA